MRIVNVKEAQREADFAKAACEDFAANPRHYTFAEGGPTPGELLAIRWNEFNALVVRLHDEHVPAVYGSHQFIGSDFPALEGSLPAKEVVKLCDERDGLVATVERLHRNAIKRNLEYRRQRRAIASLRGQITKLKKKLEVSA